MRGASPTIVFNDNRALVEQLQRGESVTHDVRIARQISYLLANEANTSYRFVPGEINRGADLLFRGKQSPMNTAQLVQPTPRERPEMDIIAQGHQGHWGFEETKKNVELAYGMWPGLAEDVKTFVERCDRCQFHGSRQHRDPPRLEISTEFGDRMCMDIAGPFRDGQYFLVLVDSATRWCEAGVLARPRADQIIPILERWMQQFPGRPKTITVDHGQVWLSFQFQRWTAARKIDVTVTPSYYPQGVGLAERAIGTLLNRLRRMCDGVVEDWSMRLQEAVDAYNTSWHRGIDSTPITLAYGLDRNRRRLPARTVRDGRQHALEVQEQAKAYMETLYRRKHPRLSKPLQVGDEVLIYDPTARSSRGKLERPWFGHLKIVAQHSKSTWIVKDLAEADRQFLVHSSQLRSYHTS